MDNKFRVPRVWSNRELKKFAELFRGRIVNVSGGTDSDKEDSDYKSYFTAKTEYFISNYQLNNPLKENEFYLDLEQEIPQKYQGAFDVVFNHTTLEHVYDCKMAFSGLCKLSSGVVICVVPYIQQMHGNVYKDYWRFTPWTMKKMYEENGFNLRYCVANGGDLASIYLFCIGYRGNDWDSLIPAKFDLALDPNKPLYSDDYRNVIGGNVIL
jgi:hypothetical protein